MTDRRWKLGICGTFDVANYGDLLFPLIAEAELSDRLGEVTLHRFSYHSKAPPDWPYEVTSIAELPEMIDDLDGLLIGGGYLIRFDKHVAPGYFPPSPEIHHPTGYWLTPALMAVQHNVPLVWNAPGAQVDGIPDWAKPLVAAALSFSGYVAVRDEGSQAVLQGLDSAPIALVPDTAFALPRLLSLEAGPSAGFNRLREACGLDRPYIAVQSIHHLAPFVQFVKANRKQFENFQFLALPIGPVLGDDDAALADLPGVVRLGEWPHPLLIAELIGRAEAVVGDSFHLCATAVAFGVPAFRRSNVWMGKYSALRRFDTVHELPPRQWPDSEWFMDRLGRTAPSEEARAACRALRGHWNRIAQVFQGERTQTAAALDGFWQSIAGRLESAANREDRGAMASKNLNGVGTKLMAARSEIAQRANGIAQTLSSLSWRLKAPLRGAGRQPQKAEKPRVIDLERIRCHRLETHPYSWAAIDNLFTPEYVASLSATYPSDHFKLLSAFDGEKNYEYEARSLIGMGADNPAYPEELSEAWQSLAADLLSPEYRAAMSNLIRCDLSKAPMEVNVFHYGPGGSLGPHKDLKEKIVTHVLYFNESWNRADGGCLRILRSQDPADVAAEIPPLIGQSSVLVRSEKSWHAVSRVASGSVLSRRSVTVTFYRRGAVSTMWPPGDATPLHRYQPASPLARAEGAS